MRLKYNFYRVLRVNVVQKWAVTYRKTAMVRDPRPLALRRWNNGFYFETYQKLKSQYFNPPFTINIFSGNSSSNYYHKTHPILYNNLKDLRDEICNDTNEEIFIVTSSKSLDEMATYLPHSKKELMEIIFHSGQT